MASIVFVHSKAHELDGAALQLTEARTMCRPTLITTPASLPAITMSPIAKVELGLARDGRIGTAAAWRTPPVVSDNSP